MTHATSPNTSRYPNVSVSGSIKLGQFLKLAGLVEDGAEARIAIQSGDVTVNGATEMRRGHHLSGGDVAIAVAHALGATGFQIRGRVAECVPYGHFLGGRWSRPVMTKAGGFGTDTTLLHVVNFIEEKLSV